VAEQINPDRNKIKRENDRFIVNVTFELLRYDLIKARFDRRQAHTQRCIQSVSF